MNPTTGYRLPTTGRNRGKRLEGLSGSRGSGVGSLALAWIVLAILGAVAGCKPRVPSPSVQIIGGPGSIDGRFATPRAAAWDPKGWIYVVDKTARIQKFDLSGRLERVWSTPAHDRGNPAGLAMDPNGQLLVADTHYHRILRYSPDGQKLAEFGSEGRDPGRFQYPVGVAVAQDGTLFVSEYGDNDRVQVFTAEGKFLRSWGRYGEEPGEFKRPQGIAAGKDRVYVADSANHRVQFFSWDGKVLGSWGGMRYPYSVSLDAEGNVWVAQYGGHCVSKFTADGSPLGSAGHAGSEPGELNTPWSAVAALDKVIVVDSGNHRLQVWPATCVTKGDVGIGEIRR